MKELQATEHSLSRKGREMPVRVMELRDRPGGVVEQVVGHVLVFGHPGDGCLVRIHSRCLYGDALQSDDCDCGPELELAMDLIQDENGQGVLIYLEQEGRGEGLVVKAMGLRTGEQTGADTFDAYRILGHPIDSRSYDHAADALTHLGLRSVRLMTNNPDKLRAVQDAGLRVEAVPLATEPRSERAALYMGGQAARRQPQLSRTGRHSRVRSPRENHGCGAAAGGSIVSASGVAVVVRDTIGVIWLR
ncbi:3,4-dihydroxy-2-butanone-4-phosphate synthase [Nocardia seriolae]|uniref:3,4-dihydroxy-2-butanone-4-phosphate synthase n=1 Tax=Nocardia seriolae TaxID=37332 RepID=A0ABC8AX10_9NOCA|nr:GTP cyclohydrolase [Nocardia seriolae]APA98774.1 3,4-dihydroxy-2-butanone-4-phosphate synthase [Nocardia seriolae]